VYFLITGRIAFKKFSGHISFVFDIVNRHTKGTFANLDEATSAVYNFQRRIQEIINSKTQGEKFATAVDYDEDS
jgi:hypothetical protein